MYTILSLYRVSTEKQVYEMVQKLTKNIVDYFDGVQRVKDISRKTIKVFGEDTLMKQNLCHPLAF